MEVILTKDVKGLGKAGDKAKVKDGFARNYLIPKGLALSSTLTNIKILEESSKRKVHALEKLKAEALTLVEKLTGKSINVAVAVHEEDKLYGSIGASNIADALKDEGIEIDKKYIVLEEPIKTLGIYDIVVKPHPEVETTIKVWVVKK